MSEVCYKLHQLVNNLEIHSFPFNVKHIPLNGIYILFEEGELSHNTNRIVRVGTHTGKNQLRARLAQHFIHEKKDRSIFRKNIGRSILYRDQNPFLDQWELDLTSHYSKVKFSGIIDIGKQTQIEREVTEYIQKRMRFVVFEVCSMEERLKWKCLIISTVSICEICKPSSQWLGLYSPIEKIRNFGLWNVNELNKKPLTDENCKEIEQLLISNGRV